MSDLELDAVYAVVKAQITLARNIIEDAIQELEKVLDAIPSRSSH